MAPEVKNPDDVFGNSLRPTRGVAQDYGIKIDLFKGRLYMTATKYKTEVVDRGLTISGNILTPLNVIYRSILDGNDYHLDNSSTYRDDTTDGYEFSINATPVRGWSIRVAVGTQDTIVGRFYDDVAN